LQLYWGYRLLELAQVHDLELYEGISDVEIIEQLILKMLNNFVNDIEYLNETEWAFLNTVIQNQNKEMDEIEDKQYATLKRLGYVYLFSHDGHIYPIIPKELISLLPQSYSEEFINRIEKKQRLFSYTLALTNLYGVFRVEQLVDVWNMYNKDKISVDDAKNYIDAMKMRQTDFWYEKGYIISSLIESENQYRDLMKNASRFPYFLPTKSDMSFYSDINKSLSSPYFKKLEEFIKSKNLIEESEIEGFVYDIFGACKLDLPLDIIMTILKDSGLEFNDEEDANEFMRLLRIASNNTRKWVLHGHMPAELAKNPAKIPVDRPQAEKPIQKPIKKIGRNDPCYCGSGKKYKHCCGNDLI
jgi:hypothetical protein